MIELLGSLKTKRVSQNNFEIPILDLKEGVNNLPDYIIIKNSNSFKIYDRICNHQGGRIIFKDKKYICPMHNWSFDPLSGKYLNGIKKKQCNFEIINEKLVVTRHEIKPVISSTSNKNDTIIRFFNHAFLNVKSEKFNFCIDPWAIGPAFNNGWWLKFKTKNDWMKKIDASDFIFISHNHPDHLNEYTLKHINKNKTILVPNFKSDSTGSLLEKIKFKNVKRLDFMKEYKLKGSNLIFSVLKSGDFREDSGLYFSNGKFSCLFDVDSNNINFGNVPEVDLYASSFAGGASAFPLMFDNYTHDEKLKIIKKDRLFRLITKKQLIKKMKPNYFLPYASFFKEHSKRDSYIFKYNKKNNISDYYNQSKELNYKLIDVTKKDELKFNGNYLESSKNINLPFSKDKSYSYYITALKKKYLNISTDYIKEYFEKSNFKSNLVVYIMLTDDSFSKNIFSFKVDFSKKKIKYNKIKNVPNIKNQKKTKIRILILKCRIESFLNTIYNNYPWEDLSIGFQCKITRFPNEYNADFWDHFSNTYVAKTRIRSSNKCNSCDILKQRILNIN